MRQDLSGYNKFTAALNVSRETLEKLEAYAHLLEQWQQKINLIGPSTLPHIWERHFLDSAQLIFLPPFKTPGGKVVLDLGSGAGFPALLLALLTPHHVHLVESDQRKSAFLRTAVRALDIRETVTIHNERVENITPFQVDIITARAFAPLSKILAMGQEFTHKDTSWLLLKGQDVDQELTNAPTSMSMNTIKHPSMTDDHGVILELRRANCD